MKTIIFLGMGLSSLLCACSSQSPEVNVPKKVTIVSVEANDNLAAKMLTMPSGNLETLDTTLEKLMGEWHQGDETFTQSTRAWMTKNKIGGFYDTFSWGTDKGWINFGDFRTVDGKAVKTGNGMISWHSGFKHLRFRETGSRGGFVDGMIEIKDENTFARHYQFFAPNGDMSYRSDTWSFDPKDLSCFMWATTSYKGGEPKTGPARKFCKNNAD